MCNCLAGGDLRLGRLHILCKFGSLYKCFVRIHGNQNGSAPAVLGQHKRTLSGLHLLDEGRDARAEFRKGANVLAGPTVLHAFLRSQYVHNNVQLVADAVHSFSNNYGVSPVLKTFITSSPRWLITFTAIRPVLGLSNAHDVSLLSVAHASSLISASN